MPTEATDTKNPINRVAKDKFRFARIAAIAIIVALLFAAVIMSITSKPSAGEQAWNSEMTIGAADSPNLYVMYTDLMCPYCDVFSRVVMDHWDEFKSYLEANHILFEVRLTDYLYESVDSKYSRDSAEAAYCAAREGKFWDYYHGAIKALWDDYQSKGIGDSKTSPAITNLPSDYWLKIGQKIGLSDHFADCIKNHETASELDEATQKALRLANGMPSFKFNRFTTAGFDSSWGWDYVKMYLDAGLGKN